MQNIHGYIKIKTNLLLKLINQEENTTSSWLVSVPIMQVI